VLRGMFGKKGNEINKVEENYVKFTARGRYLEG
jgi:hypothetical protein